MLSELSDFEHIDVESPEEAVYWLTKYGDKAKIIAGGTDLLGLMKDKIVGPKMPMPTLIVNIKTIPGFDRIEYVGGKGLRIGAATTLFDIESDDKIKERFLALSQAAESVATLQIRYTGTIGGNLCQRPWCSYFRHPDYVCFKRGGKQCYAITGNNRYYFSILKRGICVMSHPSDIAPALIALDAKIHVLQQDGERTIPIEEFFLGPRSVQETVLKDNDLITSIEVPETDEGSRSLFLKSRVRNNWDFALSTVAIWIKNSAGVCDDLRIALGGVAVFPFRAKESEELLRGKRITKKLIEEAAEAAVLKAAPLKMNTYKVKLTKSLVRRALQSV